MSLPKPLLIVIVVLVVLCLVGLGAGLMSGSGGQGPSERGATLRDSFAATLARLQKQAHLQPRSDPVVLSSPPVSCLAGDRLEIATSATCTVAVLPSDAARRQLRLKVTDDDTMAVDVRVAQTVAGHTPDPGETTIPFLADGEITDDIVVTVEKQDSAQVDLRCVSLVDCVLLVNPSD